MGMELKDKVIIVTGSSDGVGRQIALKLAVHKSALALIARNKERLEQTKKEAEQLGAKEVRIYPCDIRDTEKLAEVAKQIVSDFGKIDILINNAGIWHKRMPVEELDAGTIDSVIQTNLTAAIHLTRLAVPYLKKQPKAAIINIISNSGVVAQAGQTAYSASKYGLRGFTEVLREDLKDSNVKVAGIYPGGINTQLFVKAGEEGVPVGRFTNPADLADVVVFILTQPEKTWLYDIRIGH